MSTYRVTAKERLLLHGIALYQAVKKTGLIPPVCRFAPSCSHYAAQAIEQHGSWRGIGLAVRRLFKCHPGHPGGWDPVP